MLKCIIIDDEQSAIDVLQRFVEKIPSLQLIGTSTDPVLGIEMVRESGCDVVFLDIEMEGINGLEVAKMLQGIQIIFCTAHSEFAIDSYDVGAVDYLLKPVPFNRFVKAIQRLVNIEVPQSMQQDIIEDDYIFVRTELKGKWRKLELDELEYIEGDNNYVKLFRSGQQMTMAFSKLKNIEELLSENQFVRIHKSYLVAIKQIELIEGNTVILKRTGKELPIGSSFKNAFISKMRNRLL